MVNEPCAVAIVGMAGRFPGAPDVATFWANLVAGTESIRHFSPDALTDVAERMAHPDYVPARSILDDAACFDAEFFGIPRREAELIDPQQRLFLECAWAALEDAGYDPATYDGRIGIYGGCSINSYVLRNVFDDAAAVERFTAAYPSGDTAELIGAGHDFLATRVAYKLGLRGPALTMQSACSTSLLTVAHAVQTLQLGQADMMLAGGVSVSFPQARGYVHQAGGMTSADGHCRTFDRGATGTVFGEGVGLVVLKRLEDAIADGDAITAVIRGYGISNDAAQKVGFAAPSAAGQVAAVRAAHAMAGFAAADIGYIECHGTATPLGDPIEVAALAQAFAEARGTDASIVLGSVKPNVGHLDVAAGIAGFIKAALVVREATIPGTLHFTERNPAIDFAGVPFTISADAQPWRSAGDRRRAGVSAFGIGGTNVHIALESAPQSESVAASTRAHLLVVSARSRAALERTRARLAAHLRTLDDAQLATVANTLARGRRAFAYRDTVVATTMAQAADALERPLSADVPAVSDAPVTALLFPGQGSQYVDMGAEVYAALPVFRDAIDRCAALSVSALGVDIREVLYPVAPSEQNADALQATQAAQVAIFAVEYALAQQWMAWGLRPAAMAGHSVGEFVAAALTGVFSLEDALALVAERGRLMGACAPGAMLAVRLSAAALTPLLDGPVEIAAANAPELCVVAGPAPAIDALAQRLAAAGHAARRLATSHAFHSAMMDPIVGALTERAAAIRMQAPAAPYVSSVTGDWIAASLATSPAYWARHAREPVQFGAALQTLTDAGIDAFIEVGPGNALQTFARAGAARGTGYLVTGSLPSSARERSDLATLLASAGALWRAGVPIDPAAICADASSARIALPSYPFERTLHWRESQHPRIEQPERVFRGSRGEASITRETIVSPASSHVATVADGLTVLFEELSGESLRGLDARMTFLEMGFDSLFLGRIVQQIQTRFGVAVPFRDLLDGLPSIAALAEHLANKVPETIVAATPVASAAPLVPAANRIPADGAPAVERLMRDQLAAMQTLVRDQLAALERLQVPTVSTPMLPATVQAPVVAASLDSASAPSRYDAFRITAGAGSELSPAQLQHIEMLAERTVALTPSSKALTTAARAVLADPRVAAGFRLEWKELVYPLTAVRAKGSRIWDADGNEYIDLLNGFGQTAFGHSPDFVIDAVSAQLRDGFAIGPQTELAGEVARLFCAITGNERVTFCNTGSEAVMAAMRVARTVTGRTRIVVFEGSYHGQFDEVLVKGSRDGTRSLPVAAGIPAESVANMTVLSYGAPESLTWIREHAHELAAVIVEPVQSRHPALVPREFLHELRALTAASGTALVFDEVVTGFRTHPGGMQALLEVRADLATYGKVVGGGMPIGLLAGTPRFMDALDGGTWQFGDASVPEIPPTFFAGTFVRHPLAMAAVLAVLQHVEAAGPALQLDLSARTADLVERLNNVLAQRAIATRIESFASMFYMTFAREERNAGLLYYHLRNRGVYLQEGFPCFLTTAHTDADVDTIVGAFDASLAEMQAAGFFGGAIAAPALVASLEIPPTESQLEIWLAAQSGDEASCAFNESVTLELRGSLDRAALERAWNLVLARHEALRATFSRSGEVMIVHPSLAVPLDSLAGADALHERIRRDAAEAFDLVRGPLVRTALVRLADDHHAFVLTAHHIVCDGWSINIIAEELAHTYSANVGAAVTANAEPLSFRAYAGRLLRRDLDERAATAAYWRESFRAPVPALELPVDRPRPAQPSYAGATRTASIDAAVLERIRRSGARNGSTLFTTLLAGFGALVGKLGGRRDLVVGVPTAGQSALDEEILVGHCVNFLPIRLDWSAHASVAELLATTKRRVLDAYEHQQYTLGTLVADLAGQATEMRAPRVDLQFNLERFSRDIAFHGLDVTIVPNPKAFVNFDLFLNVIESAEGLRLDCDYRTDLFDASTIDRWLGYYVALLGAFADEPATAVSDIAYLPASELDLLRAFNATEQPIPLDHAVQTLFEQHAARHPDRIAIRCGSSSLTYDALDARANRLANVLLKRSGGTRKLVGVLVGRSIDMVVALLATLKAGCAYVPLDPTHPPARLRRILTDADVAALIVDDGSVAARIGVNCPVIDLARERAAIDAESAGLPHAIVAPDDLAYVISTSGSTGAPKGVEITHRSVVNLLAAMASEPGMTAADTLLAVTTIAFDIAALELFLPLSVGGTVIVATADEVADGFVLRERVREATIMQATPATWRLLLEAGFPGSPDLTMLCGGEALTRELADRLLSGGGALWNVYGPTETTIWSACGRVRADGRPVSVGRPIANTQIYLLDDDDRNVAPGAIGHVHIAGAGVARGYLNRADLTAEKFVPNPFGPGRLYRTGDIGRLQFTGELQILGRSDQQIKLRGYRIELGEIEAVLERNARLAAVAVVLREDAPGEGRLVAYYVARQGVPHSSNTLLAAIENDLPKYMVPTVWIELPEMPLSPAGKIDRAALPAPSSIEPPESPHPSAMTETERALAAIWIDVLHVDRIGIDDNLFAMGADSLQLFAITARANAAGIPLAAKELFRYPTIAALARRLDAGTRALAGEPVVEVASSM